MKIISLLLLLSVSVLAQQDFVTNTATYLENNFVIEISTNYQNPPNTKFISSFCKLSEEFKVQLKTSEYNYFNYYEIGSREYQGVIILNFIYFGVDNFNPHNIKFILDYKTEYDFEVDSDSKLEFIEKSKKYRISCHTDVPISILKQFLDSKSPTIRFDGSRIFKNIIVKQKTHKFLYSFYNSLLGYYFDGKTSGD